jgi:hypothetical protein
MITSPRIPRTGQLTLFIDNVLDTWRGLSLSVASAPSGRVRIALTMVGA